MPGDGAWDGVRLYVILESRRRGELELGLSPDEVGSAVAIDFMGKSTASCETLESCDEGFGRQIGSQFKMNCLRGEADEQCDVTLDKLRTSGSDLVAKKERTGVVYSTADERASGFDSG